MGNVKTLEELLHQTNQLYEKYAITTLLNDEYILDSIYEALNELRSAHYRKEGINEAVGHVLMDIARYCYKQGLDMNTRWSEAYDDRANLHISIFKVGEQNVGD